MTLEGKDVAEAVLDGTITIAAGAIAGGIFLTDAPLSAQVIPVIIVGGIAAAAWKTARQWKVFTK